MVESERQLLLETYERTRYWIPPSFHGALVSGIECANVSEFVMINELLSFWPSRAPGQLIQHVKRFRSQCNSDSILLTIFDPILRLVASWESKDEEELFMQHEIGMG